MEDHPNLLERLRDAMGCEYISDLKIYGGKETCLKWMLDQTDLTLHEMKDAVFYIFGEQMKSNTVKACREEIKKKFL